MAISVVNTSNSGGALSSPSTVSLTLSAGTNRKIVVVVNAEVASANDSNVSVTFDGTAMTLGPWAAHSTNTTPMTFIFWYDVPDAKAGGSYDLVITAPASTSSHCYQLAGAATGAPEATAVNDTPTYSSATVTLPSMAVSDGALMIASFQNGSASNTWDSYSAEITERTELNEAAWTSAVADGIKSGAGSVSLTGTSSSANVYRVAAAVSIAASAGGVSITDAGRSHLAIGSIGQGNGFGYKRF